MPSAKRFSGTMNFHIPHALRRGIEERVAKTGETRSEVMRKLLEIGLNVVESQDKGA